MLRLVMILTVSLSSLRCGGDLQLRDAGSQVDSGQTDASNDRVDAGSPGLDAGAADGGLDPAVDGGPQPSDAGSDAGLDAGADAGLDAGATVLTLQLHRGDAGIIASVQAANALGPLAVTSVFFSIGDGGRVSATTALGDGGYQAHVETSFPSGELPITAAAFGATATRVALVLPVIDERWGSPRRCLAW